MLGSLNDRVEESLTKFFNEDVINMMQQEEDRVSRLCLFSAVKSENETFSHKKSQIMQP